MPTPTIADYLKFANLQMAAEALYGFNAVTDGATLVPGELGPSSPLDADNLTTGNLHASKFSPTEVTLSKLTTDWIVVEHKSDTTTGFSGTLFKNKDSGELVLSFRSTEFIDDAARDNEATNKLEIKEKGWAFGQLSDMETWYQSLQLSGKIDGPLSVTGYSLGGHLATAFNLMHLGAAQQVVTFNGAGVGKIGDGGIAQTANLLAMIQSFSGLRSEAEETGLRRLLQTEYGRTAYQSLKSLWSPGMPRPGLFSVSAILALPNGGTAEVFSDLALLRDAWNRADAVYSEARRAPTLDSGVGEGIRNPANIPDASIAGESLDYQLAVLVTSRDFHTSALSIPASLENAFIAKTMGAGSPLANQIDIVGTEMDAAIAAAMVANSQVHYGQDVPVFIEDQPGYRGIAPLTTGFASFVNAGAKLLAPGYAKNDFGDTHSLVLMMDSLSVMDTLARIDPNLKTKAGDLGKLFQAVTVSKAQTQPGRQGIAEGDTLETVVDALHKLFLGIDPRIRELDGLNDGNTWWDTGRRETFYLLLKAINSAIGSGPPQTIDLLMNQTESGLAGLAGSDDVDGIGYRYALKELNPFAVLGDNSLYTNFNPDHELDLFDAETGKGLSPKWIEDRGAFLANVIAANVADTGQGKALRVEEIYSEPAYFLDKATGLSVQQVNSLDGNSVGPTYQFGAAASETLKGGKLADHLYGAAGTDILKGKAGDDYLEGGAGNDKLHGGNGNDTYRIDKNSGVDTIIDYAGNGLLDFSHGAGAGDGQGSIVYNGQTLTGNLTRDAADRNLYHSTDNDALLIRFTGTFNDRGKLVITDPAGATIIVQNWKSGELGLTLADSPSTIQSTDLTGTAQGDNSELTAAGHGATLTSTAANQKVYGLEGADLIQLVHQGAIGYGGFGNDIITNGDGDQTLLGEAGNDILIASSGDDTLAGGTGDDALQGGADDDLLDGGEGMDLLDGGQGADVIKGGVGDDIIFGGGNLTVSVTRYESALDHQHFADGQIDLLRRGGDGHFILPTLIGVSPTNADGLETALTHIQGDGADAIDGGAGDDMVFAGDGDDVVEGQAGQDTLVGDAGNDFMTGGSEDDSLYGDGAEGDFVAPTGGEGLVGWTLDQFHGDDYLDGGDGNDSLSGDGGADEVFGGAGNDRLIGDNDNVAVAFHGNDYLDGEAGNDSLWGYGGNDELVGGTGDDRLEGDSATVAFDKHGDDYLDGGDGADTLLGDGGADTLFGGAGNDELHGDAADVPLANQGGDYLEGEAGDDYLSGYGGGDELAGGAGDDILQGGEGKDTLEGSSGIDLMQGGAGDDAYVFSTGDAPFVVGMAEGIVDTAGKDTLRFGAGIALANITARRANADDLLLDIGTDWLLIEHGLAGAQSSSASNDEQWREAA
jgi:Ca2+-binding RTX toxin-like protein